MARVSIYPCLYDSALCIKLLILNNNMDIEKLLHYNPAKISYISTEEALEVASGRSFEQIIIYNCCFSLCVVNDKYILIDCNRERRYLLFHSKYYLDYYLRGERENCPREVIYKYFADYGLLNPRVVLVYNEKNILKVIGAYEGVVLTDLSDTDNTVYRLKNGAIAEVFTYNTGNLQFCNIFESQEDYLKYVYLLESGTFESHNKSYDLKFATHMDTLVEELMHELELNTVDLNYSYNSLDRLAEKCFIYNKTKDLNGIKSNVSAYLSKYLLLKETGSTIEMIPSYSSDLVYYSPYVNTKEGKIYNVDWLVLKSFERLVTEEYFPYFYFNLFPTED